MSPELTKLLQSYEAALWNQAVQESNECISDRTVFKLIAIREERKEALTTAIEHLESNQAFLRCPVPELADKYPLVLYFQTKKDAAEFADMVQLAKPNFISKII